MPIGITNLTQPINMTNITSIGNASSVPELMINLDHALYGGWLYFILLILLWFIVLVAMEKARPQLGINLMYSGAIVSVISLLSRGIAVVNNGVIQGFLSGFQMYFFPIATILIAVTMYALKDV